jgi:hypothetical protein
VKNKPEARSYRRTATMSEIRARAIATLNKATGSAEDEFQIHHIQGIFRQIPKAVLESLTLYARLVLENASEKVAKMTMLKYVQKRLLVAILVWLFMLVVRGGPPKDCMTGISKSRVFKLVAERLDYAEMCC